VFGILTPLFDTGGHIIWQRCLESHSGSGPGVNKSQGTGVQSLPGQNFKTVFDELTVFRETGTLEDLISSVSLIVKESMTNVLHVYPYLVCTACL
jgi:hypothetical protein